MLPGLFVFCRISRSFSVLPRGPRNDNPIRLAASGLDNAVAAILFRPCRALGVKPPLTGGEGGRQRGEDHQSQRLTSNAASGILKSLSYAARCGHTVIG